MTEAQVKREERRRLPRYAKERKTTMMVKAHAKRDEAMVRGWACAKQEAALLSPKTALTAKCGGCVTRASTGVRRVVTHQWMSPSVAQPGAAEAEAARRPAALLATPRSRVHSPESRQQQTEIVSHCSGARGRAVTGVRGRCIRMR